MNKDEKYNVNEEKNTPLTAREHLEDESAKQEDERVKALSPGLLVIKRFMRNKLAIVGIVILVLMFLFSFVGGMISPYKENQIFYKTEMLNTQYASAAKSTTLQMTLSDTAKISAGDQSKIITAAQNGETSINLDGTVYHIYTEGENLYRVSGPEQIAACTYRAQRFVLSSGSNNMDDGLRALFESTLANGGSGFTYNGRTYTVTNTQRFDYTLNSMGDIGTITNMLADAIESGADVGFEFKLNAVKAIQSGASEFTLNGQTYGVVKNENVNVVTLDGKEYATISNVSMRALASDLVLTTSFKIKLINAIDAGLEEFTEIDEDGTEITYTITNKNGEYSVLYSAERLQYDIYAAPSAEHWLGTDGNAMDNITRLMYGGRISLMIGFVVVIIELLIGVTVGGLAGYFGGWVDQLLMRFVDVIICIPAYPLYIILASIMDAYKIPSQTRIFYLMIMLGAMSWPGIARMVRGQILSLREQEFMIATEATGIPVRRRIFKHLVPNVIPQLIVIATMDLGSIIITEATLSFLGLGVKFPYASWGNIINAVSSIYVMTNYWFVWIPAGILILITVLGFNFIGDGLRDAFDPKMKR